MKKLFTLFLFLSSSIIQGQQLKYDLDYEVNLKFRKDTIQLWSNKEGSVIYTKDNSITQDFSKRFTRSFKNANEPVDVSLVLDTKEDFFIIHFSSGKSHGLIRMDILDFIPKEKNPKRNYPNKIICNEIEKNGFLLQYTMTPDTEPDNPVIVSLDTSKKFDANHVLAFIFKIKMQAFHLKTDLPNGFPMEMKVKDGMSLLNTLNIQKVNKQIKISQNFILEQ